MSDIIAGDTCRSMFGKEKPSTDSKLNVDAIEIRRACGKDFALKLTLTNDI